MNKVNTDVQTLVFLCRIWRGMELNKVNRTLNTSEVAHLLRRATYGPSIEQIKKYEGKKIDDILDVLFAPNDFGLSYLPFDPQSGQVWVTSNNTRADYLMVSYLQFYVYLNHLENFHIQEKLTEFLYMFAACGVHERKPQAGFHLYNHCVYHTDKNMKDFAHRLIRNSLYLETLNNDQNTKNSPIEDAGREFLEMAAIGKGEEVGLGDYTTYTEQDVQQLSRIMTGLRPAYVYDGTANYTDPDTGIPRGVIASGWHDTDNKTFSPRFNNQVITGRSSISGVETELSDFIDMLYSKREPAEYYVRRMYRFFASDVISATTEQDVIQPLVDDLINGNWELLPVVRKLLSSEHFFSSKVEGAKLKSGMDFMASVQNGFQVTMPDRNSNTQEFWHDLGRDSMGRYLLSRLDHEPLNPPTIAGYAGNWVEDRFSHAWISHNNLGFRQLIADMIATDSKIFTAWDRVHLKWAPSKVLTSVNSSQASEVVDDLVKYLFPMSISSARRSYFLNDVLLDGNNPTYWTTASQAVKEAQIEKLTRALVQAPEFQIN